METTKYCPYYVARVGNDRDTLPANLKSFMFRTSAISQQSCFIIAQEPRIDGTNPVGAAHVIIEDGIKVRIRGPYEHSQNRTLGQQACNDGSIVSRGVPKQSQEKRLRDSMMAAPPKPFSCTQILFKAMTASTIFFQLVVPTLETSPTLEVSFALVNGLA